MKIKGTEYSDYDTYIRDISMIDVLKDAGYVLDRRQGMKYPTFVKVDEVGRRIPGEKFVVTADKKRCFQHGQLQTWNVVGFIRDHSELFPESRVFPGDTVKIINEVLTRIGKKEKREVDREIYNQYIPKTFDIAPYTLRRMDKDDFNTIKPFYPYFKSRGIDINTQKAFSENILLTSKPAKEDTGKVYSNLSFPLRVPNSNGDIVGLEERGLPRLDGSSGYKGLAYGSNASEGMWIASPWNTSLLKAKDVFIFESGYDAMAFYQLYHRSGNDMARLDEAVYISTAGNPSNGQMRGMLKNTPAVFHLCFDNDMAGNQFVEKFRQVAESSSPSSRLHRIVPPDGSKDWNEMLLRFLDEDEEETKKLNVGLDFDGDGEVTTEEAEEVKERKHHIGR